MNTIVEHINSAGFSFTEFAVPMLVQSGILIVILLLADLLLRKKVKAVFRYWIWMLVLVKLVLPTSLSSPLSLGYLFGEKLTYQELAETASVPEPAGPMAAETLSGINPLYIQPNPYVQPKVPVTSVVEPVIAEPTSPPPPVTPLSWQGVVFLVWLAVVIAMGLLLLQRALFVRGLVAQAKDAPHLMNDALEYCRESMKIKCKVGLKISPNATTPSVCGLIRPVVLVPWNLASTLGASRLRTVLMHELAHIRRVDLWVNLAQTILQIIYFYNPLLWLANCVIRRIREQAVDEAVLVAMGKGAQQYPQTLVDVAKMAFKRPALSLRLIGVVESESALAGRIKHILGRPMPKTARLSIVSVLSILITASVLLPMARAGRGVVLTVAADGSAEYSSIQKAIDAASAGAVVRIAPGVYKEQIKIDKPLTLEGAGWDKTTITAENNTADVFEEVMDKMKEEFARVAMKRMQDAKTEQERKAIEAEFETEFKAKLKDKFDMQAVLVSDTEGVVIRGLKISFSGRHIEGRLISVPIVRFSNAEAKMFGCVLTGCPGDGIHVMDGSDLEIRSCLVGGLWSTGIVVGEEGGAGSRLRILDSDVRNCYYAGIWIRAGNKPAEIKRCRVSGAAWHGIIYSGNSPVIEDNAVFGNARIGIGASHGAAGTVRRNIIYGNEIGGMSCSYGSRPVIKGNTFANNKESGLRIFNTAKPIVRKNIFVGNPTAVFCGNFGGDEPSVWFDGVVTLENNLFWDHEHKAVWQHLATEEQELKVEDISLGKETGNIEFDPLFADLQGKDFSLSANSPALVSGIGVSEPPAFDSPWPLQDEELAIIPDGDTRDWRHWKQKAESNPMARAKNEDGFSDRDLLIKFTELPEGEAKKVSVDDITIWSKSYEVEFAPGEDMLVTAEVYQAGKPMRILGNCIFEGSQKPEKFTVTFVRTYQDASKTYVTHNVKFQLGRQVFKIPEFQIYTARHCNTEAWDWYRGEGLWRAETRHTKTKYAGIETLLYCGFADASQESEDKARFWIPGRDVTAIMMHYCIALKMIPLSSLEYLSVEPVGGLQDLDGKIIPTDLTIEKANEMADDYRSNFTNYLPKVKAEKRADREIDEQAGSLDHFVGRYAMAGHPDTAAFEITKKGDVFIFRDLGGPKFEMDIVLRGLGGRRFEMEKGRDNLKFGDNPRERYRVRYNAAEDHYILDSLGMRGEVQDSMISPLTDLIKIYQEKPTDKTNVQVGIEPDSTVQAIPLKAFEFKLVENLLDLVKQVEKQYPQQATHWPAGAGLYHIDAQGQVTVWHYRSLWQRSNDCAPDEVGWGSSQLVNAVGMYYLPDGTPLQSRWRERGGGMKDIRIQVGREVGESERVPVIHRHRLPSNHDLLSSDGLERKLLLDSWKDLPVAIIVRVDKPMRLAGWWLGDVKTDSQHFNEYDQLIVKGPPGNNNKPMLVTVGLPETDVRVGIENNISPKLVMLLDAINSCAAEVDLNIDSVSITDRNVSIKGDTSGRTNTRKFLDAVKDNGLNVSSLRLNAAGSRDKFIIIVEPEKDQQQWFQKRKTDVQLGAEQTVSPKLVMLLTAINSVAAGMDLNIESISVTAKSMSIEGDTSNRMDTLKLLDAVKDNGLEVSQLNLDERNNLDRFRMDVKPNENWRQLWQKHKTAVPVEGEGTGGKNALAWGGEVDGLQLGLSYDSAERPYYQGEIVSFDVHIRNNGNEAVDLSYVELFHWCPHPRHVTDANDAISIVNVNFIRGDASAQEEHISLGPGDRHSLGKVAMQIGPLPKGAQRTKYSADLQPGEYIVTQTGKFGGIGYDSWRGELITGELPLIVLPTQTGIGPPKTRGGISGVVVNSVTGQPIAGAYVGVGDFGDSGGSNYSRHRSEGFHDKTKTDAEGRFELNGLVFTDKHRELEYHPLVVTHPDFVRHDKKIELLSGGPVPEVKVSLRPAAKIDVTIVDGDGSPLQGQWLLRLEALDGRRFIPPGSDPHLSSFASNVWAHWPDMRTNMGFSNGFTFTELDSGWYLIEAIRVRLVDKPAPGNIWKPTITYHGSIPSLEIEAGQSKQVRLTPQDNQTQMTITAPEFPDKLFDKLERSSQMPLMCLISRSPGALLWDDGKIRHLEDQRFGRIDKKRFFRGFFSQGQPLVIDNLPPDSYSLFAMAVYGQVAGYLIGARADLAKGDNITVDIPWRQPTGPSIFGPNRSFDYPVKLETREYSVSGLCENLTGITQSNPRIIADPSIENEKLNFGESDMSVWDVLEKLYQDNGWTVEEGQDKTLIIRTADKTKLPVEVGPASKLETRVYNIFDLIAALDPNTGKVAGYNEDDANDILQHIIDTVEPDSWYQAGGEGRIEIYKGYKLIVFQTREIHQKVEQLLGGMRASPSEQDTSVRKRIEFLGLDLTDAPRTTKLADLSDLFEARPPGSKSYHRREDIDIVYSGLDGKVYYIPDKEIFYVQHDKLGASTLTYYGPFNGDPHLVLDIEKDWPVDIKETEAASRESEVTASEDGPRITFESPACDLGQVPPNTKHVCEFKFTNTGNEVLKITRVRSACACATSKLKKKEYAPGESGTLEVIYQSVAHAGRVTKNTYIYSNDNVNPKVALTIKAEIVIKVAHEPKILNILLKGENAGCPPITLTSLDNQPFSITGLKSSGDSITAEFDPSVKDASFVLKPKVDMEKLGKGLNGRIEISLNHPECNKLMIVYKTLPEFEFDPRVVYVREAEPLKTVTKTVRIRSNYNEDVEVESTSSKKGTVEVLTQQKVRNGYQFELQITPPVQESNKRVFTDVFTVRLKSGRQIQITCYGIYSKKPVKTAVESAPKTDSPVEAEDSSKPAIQIESRLLMMSEELLEDIGLKTNSVYNADSKFKPAVVESTDSPISQTHSFILDDINVSLLVRAVQADKASTAIITPKVTVVNGKDADFSVHTQVDYISDYTEPNRPSGEPEPKHDFVEIGTWWKVNPKITPDNKHILLDVDFEMCNLLGFEERMYKQKYAYKIPQTEASSIKTRLLVPDGQTVLMAGEKVAAEEDGRKVQKELLVLIKAQKADVPSNESRPLVKAEGTGASSII